MNRLNNFKLDKDLDSNQIYLSLKRHIDEYTNQDDHKKYLDELSKILDIPNHILDLKFKRIVYNNFDLNSLKFKNKFSLIKLFFNFIIFLTFLFCVKIFGRNKISQKRFDVIIDEVDGIRQFKKFNKIIEKFNSPIIFTKNKTVQNELENRGIKSIRYNRIIPSKILLIKNFLSLIIFYFQVFMKNLMIKENYFIFYTKILLAAIKSETLFSKAISEIVLQDRFYINCPIKNYFFKKYGGRKIMCCQNHLAESGICFYSDIDILFSFGNEKNTEKKLRIFGSRIDSTIPVGSLSMERECFIENENLSEIDLLIVGVIPAHLKMSNRICESYYKYLNWIKNFLEENPKIKVLYKHHASFVGMADPREQQILNSSNIKILSKGNSYSFLKKSKVVISYCSTMILEGLSLKKKCFFVDPDDSGSNFFSYHDYDRYFYIKSYQEFCEKIISNIKAPETIKTDFDRMCLNSDDVSEKIYKRLILLKN